MKKISIIIVTFHSSDIIEGCLNSIQQQADINTGSIEVIIVDNSNEEEFIKLSSIIRTHELEVNLIKSGGNRGYGTANNIGIRKSSGEYIIIMNPDIIMTEPLFLSCLNTFKQNNKLAMIGYKQMGGLDLSFYIRAEFFFPVVTSFLVKISNKLNIYINNYMYLSGAFLFIRKRDFEEIGLFDENIFLYNEEPDITKRFLLNDKQIMFDKSKSYLHDIGFRNELSTTTLKFQRESQLYYLEKFNFKINSYFKKYLFELKLKKNLLQIFDKQEKAEYYKRQIVEIQLFLRKTDFLK